MVLCSVLIRNILPKSAYWHFNSALAVDQSFRDALVYFWTGWSDFTCLRQWWDHGKVQVRLLCQQNTLNSTGHISGSIRDLESEINELESLSVSTGSGECIETLRSRRKALANLLDTKVQGALVRSRVQNIAEMDAPTSFFFGLERNRGQRRLIHSLMSDRGQQLTDPEQIRTRAVEFYSSLYQSEAQEDADELLDYFHEGLPQISVDTNRDLDRPLTVQELQAALQAMQGQKAPGIDGLTVEFYKAFWDILAKDILEVFNESLAAGTLPLSCCRAVIACQKKGIYRK